MNIRNLKKATALLLTGTVLLTGLTACGEKKSDSSDKYKLKVVTSASAAPINPLVQVAEQEGYFDDYGLSIEYVPLESSGVFESVSVGKVDTTYGQLIPGLSYGAQKSDVTLFGGTISGGMAAVCRKEDYDKLKNPSNWSGKNIGVIQLSTSEMITKYVLGNEYGYKIGDDLNFTYVEDYPSISLAVGKGTVDIGFLPSNFLDGAKDQGLVELFPLSDLQKDFVCCRQTAYSGSVKENRDAYVAYLKAQILAYRDYKNDKEKTIKDVVAESGQTEDVVDVYLYDEEENANRIYNPDPNYNGTLAVYDTLVEWKYVEDGVDLSEFFDISIYADALKEIIDENKGDEFFEDMWKYFLENNNEYPEFSSNYTEL